MTGLSKILTLKVVKVDNNKVTNSRVFDIILFKLKDPINLSKFN